MTTSNYTKSNTVLLSACEHYMRITQTDEESFIHELLSLSVQYCDNLSIELVEQLTAENSATDLHP